MEVSSASPMTGHRRHSPLPLATLFICNRLRERQRSRRPGIESESWSGPSSADSPLSDAATKWPHVLNLSPPTRPEIKKKFGTHLKPNRQTACRRKNAPSRRLQNQPRQPTPENFSIVLNPKGRPIEKFFLPTRQQLKQEKSAPRREVSTLAAIRTARTIVNALS